MNQTTEESRLANFANGIEEIATLPVSETPVEITQTETIDMTPTWEGVAHMIEPGLVNGNFDGQKIAREELRRMAGLADSYVAAMKSEEALHECLRVAFDTGFASCQDGDDAGEAFADQLPVLAAQLAKVLKGEFA